MAKLGDDKKIKVPSVKPGDNRPPQQGSTAKPSSAPIDSFGESLAKETPLEKQLAATAPTENAPAQSGEQAAVDPSNAATAGTEAPATSAAPAPAKPAEPVAAKPAEPAAEPIATPATPKTIDLNPAESIRLRANMPEYTREQIANAIEQYPQLLTNANEAGAFREIFGMDANGAKTQWQPMIQKLRNDTEFAEYMDRCIRTYGEYENNDGRQTQPMTVAQPSQIEVETRQRLSEVSAWQARQERENGIQQIRQEEGALKAADPRLEDPEVWGMVFESTMLRAQRDPNYTLTQAVRDLAPRINRMTAAQPAPAQNPVPVLIAGGGAGSRPAREAVNPDPQQFRSLDDGVADWKKVRASLGFTD